MKNQDKLKRQDPVEVACMLSAIIEECIVKIKLNRCGSCMHKYCTVQGMVDYLNLDDGRESVFT